VPAALDAWESSQYRTDRAVDSLYATAEEVLHVYGNERVAAFTEGHDLDLDSFLAGNNTIYLYAPAHQQRLLRPLFEAITQQVVAAAQEQAALAPDGMLAPRLGLFLDEAATAPPSPTSMSWPPRRGGRASSSSRSGTTSRSWRLATAPRHRPS
jgi:type IV secretory pathway TraG/TraD family ATPase VirD4